MPVRGVGVSETASVWSARSAAKRRVSSMSRRAASPRRGRTRWRPLMPESGGFFLSTILSIERGRNRLDVERSTWIRAPGQNLDSRSRSTWMDCLLLVSSESDSAALAPLQQDFCVSTDGLSRTVHRRCAEVPCREAYVNARRAFGRCRVCARPGPRLQALPGTRPRRFEGSRGGVAQRRRPASRKRRTRARSHSSRETLAGLRERWLDQIEGPGECTPRTLLETGQCRW